MKQLSIVLIAAAFVSASAIHADSAQWSVSRVGPDQSLLQINYGGPQYAALQTKDSYLRLVTGPNCSWGTSIVTMPSYWAGGALHQGQPITVTWKVDGQNLILTSVSDGGPLKTAETITLSPPKDYTIRAVVDATSTGAVTLDSRPGEAFKPVFLSSMHDSASSWDSSAAFVGNQTVALPTGSWIVPASPVEKTTTFGLTGGSSDWKKNAPTVKITLSKPLQVAGWLTTESDPNGDNVGLWAASDTILGSWSYTIAVSSDSTRVGR